MEQRSESFFERMARAEDQKRRARADAERGYMSPAGYDLLNASDIGEIERAAARKKEIERSQTVYPDLSGFSDATGDAPAASFWVVMLLSVAMLCLVVDRERVVSGMRYGLQRRSLPHHSSSAERVEVAVATLAVYDAAPRRGRATPIGRLRRFIPVDSVRALLAPGVPQRAGPDRSTLAFVPVFPPGWVFTGDRDRTVRSGWIKVNLLSSTIWIDSASYRRAALWREGRPFRLSEVSFPAFEPWHVRFRWQLLEWLSPVLP